MGAEEIRIDKWMWAVRIFKTRTIATEACKKGRVSVANSVAKPSRMIKSGEVIQVRKPPITYSFRVIELTANRVGAKLVQNYLENVTPAEEYEILEMSRLSGFVDRAKGLGRPTKKDRRELEDFTSSDFDFDFDFDFETDDRHPQP
ncbi:MAG: RNA-binding S4 domain-containing protein [Tannerellaceae bacterium]|jgi:ribosome-associated heat shock protein Hsp15|nr:RNA-binding S4 domain-containing protein [Tannerellaceae bacterium]